MVDFVGFNKVYWSTTLSAQLRYTLDNDIHDSRCASAQALRLAMAIDIDMVV